ncbi:MAG: hypothetical protein GY859_08680 [Desulfobacterales bacterium]|nr:hypothetical protein [Desulfobacterales bacterium]
MAPGEVVIIEACFQLTPADPAALKKEARDIMQNRLARQPLGAATAGCVFKNPPRGKGAGELIDLAGLKGRRVGGAQVSARHANFIVNRGGASARDVLDLMEIIRGEVDRVFHVKLEPEVKTIGAKQTTTEST